MDRTSPGNGDGRSRPPHANGHHAPFVSPVGESSSATCSCTSRSERSRLRSLQPVIVRVITRTVRTLAQGAMSDAETAAVVLDASAEAVKKRTRSEGGRPPLMMSRRGRRNRSNIPLTKPIAFARGGRAAAGRGGAMNSGVEAHVEAAIRILRPDIHGLCATRLTPQGLLDADEQVIHETVNDAGESLDRRGGLPGTWGNRRRRLTGVAKRPAVGGPERVRLLGPPMWGSRMIRTVTRPEHLDETTRHPRGTRPRPEERRLETHACLRSEAMP